MVSGHLVSPLYRIDTKNFKTYEYYSRKEFEIVAVAIDQEEEWKNFIKREISNGLTYICHTPLIMK